MLVKSSNQKLKSLLKLLIILLVLSVSITSGYSQKSKELNNPKIVTHDESGTKTVYPLVIAKFPKHEIELDSMALKKINPKWIKKIEVHKDGEGVQHHGKRWKDGVVLIYFKKRKRKLAYNTISKRKTAHNGE